MIGFAGVCDFEGGTMGFPFVEDKKTRLGELKEMVDKWAPMFQRIISSNAVGLATCGP